MARDPPLKAILVLALLCGLVQQTSAAFVETAYTATLSGGQQVPFVGNIFNAGTAVCIYDRNAQPKILECEIQHNVPVATHCSIYRGAAGTVGPAVYTFTVLLSSNFRQTFRLRDFDGYTVDQQEDDFLNGNWYLSILSDDYPTGDIRGQLGHTDRIYTRLSYLFTIPRASGTTAHGLGLGTYSFGDPNRQIALDIVHDVQNPTSIDIHRGNRGEVGPQLYSLKVTSSPIFAHFDYTIGEEIEFLQDKHYVQVKSQKNPAGEIRGSAIVIDYIENVAFTSRLDEANVNPNSGSDATGCALVTYNCETRVMEYLVFHNVEEATGAFVHAGSPGNNGAIRFSLSRAKSPIYGLVELNAEEEYLLYTNQLYFNIISAEFSSGEIRGQIGIEFEFYSYLSGTNVVPPVTTSSVGCATFKLSSARTQIDYDIHHSVADSVGASVYLGNEGENGVSKLDFASTVSPITGRDFGVNEQRLYDLINNNLYIQVESTDHQEGEVRGQIRRINPCIVDNNSGLTLGSSVAAGSSQISASYVFSPRSSGGGNTNSISTANTNSIAESPNASSNNNNNSPSSNNNNSPSSNNNNSPNASPNASSNNNNNNSPSSNNNNSPSSGNTSRSTRQETTINNGLTSDSTGFNRFTTDYFDAPASRIVVSSTPEGRNVGTDGISANNDDNNNSSDSPNLIPRLFVALFALLVLLF